MNTTNVSHKMTYLKTAITSCFFLAFYLLVSHEKRMGVLKRVGILFLFFFSFSTNSLLVFYGIVPLYIFSLNHSRGVERGFKDILIFGGKRLDFLLLPLVYYFVKYLFFSPGGLYVGYNQVSLSGLLSIYPYLQVFNLSFIGPIVVSLRYIAPFWPALSFLALVVAFFRFRFRFRFGFGFRNKYGGKLVRGDVYSFFIGGFCFFLGAFPYMAVEKTPRLYDWDSRFQLLLNLGFSLILYFGIKIFSSLIGLKSTIRDAIYLLFISSFFLFHVYDGIKFNIDWQYQQSLIANFAKLNSEERRSTFIVEFDILDHLANSRTFRFYELGGMYKRSTGKEDKLFIENKEQIKEYKKYKLHKEYNFSEWKEGDVVRLRVKNGEGELFGGGVISDIKSLLSLKYLEFIEADKYKEAVIKLVKIKYE